jgi:hypothetical protein
MIKKKDRCSMNSKSVVGSVTMAIEGDEDWHAHLKALASLCKTHKGHLLRKAIEKGLPAVVKQMVGEDLQPYADQHLEAMKNGKRGE